MGFKEWIIPQEKKFFDMLDRQAEKIKEGTVLFQEMLNNFDNVKEKCTKLKQIETEADDLVHHIFYELNKTFITPIDREDISVLASKLDDIIDYTYAAANRIFLYEIQAPTPAMHEFANDIVKSMDEIVKALTEIRNIGDARKISECCAEVNRLENHSDEVLNAALAVLFAEKEPLKVIKLKEIYDILEKATDSCEDVAVIIGNIVIKHS